MNTSPALPIASRVSAHDQPRPTVAPQRPPSRAVLLYQSWQQVPQVFVSTFDIMQLPPIHCVPLHQRPLPRLAHHALQVHHVTFRVGSPPSRAISAHPHISLTVQYTKRTPALSSERVTAHSHGQRLCNFDETTDHLGTGMPVRRRRTELYRAWLQIWAQFISAQLLFTFARPTDSKIKIKVIFYSVHRKTSFTAVQKPVPYRRGPTSKAYGYGLRPPRHRTIAVFLRPYAVYGTAYSPTYLWLIAADARCSSRWSMAGMTEAMLGVPPREKNNVASLKI